jgi:vacuolar-type H+-ATPase subunit I/STV1
MVLDVGLYAHDYVWSISVYSFRYTDSDNRDIEIMAFPFARSYELCRDRTPDRALQPILNTMEQREFFAQFTAVMNKLHTFKGELDNFRLELEEQDELDETQREILELIEQAHETVENDIEADLSDHYQTFI